MKKAELEFLESAVANMRRLGIISLKTGNLELLLGPPPEEAQPALDQEPEVEQVQSVAKRGKDGLTPEEQELLYGQPVKGDF